jgi:hypothetical protein
MPNPFGKFSSQMDRSENGSGEINNIKRIKIVMDNVYISVYDIRISLE